MTKKWQDLKRRMSPAAQQRVNQRVKAELAALPLAEIRKAIGMTQEELAQSLDTGQGSVSKIEHAADMYLTTLRKYVEALGGELVLKASFPNGREFQIDRLDDLAA